MKMCSMCNWALKPGERDVHAVCAAKYESRMKQRICVKCGLRDATRDDKYCPACESDATAPYRGYSGVS